MSKLAFLFWLPFCLSIFFGSLFNEILRSKMQSLNLTGTTQQQWWLGYRFVYFDATTGRAHYYVKGFNFTTIRYYTDKHVFVETQD